MPKFVAGSYATIEAVEEAIKGLIEKGHKQTDFLLVTNSQDKKERLAKDTGIEVITETGHDENFDWKELAPLYPSFDEEALYEPSPQHPYTQMTPEQEEEQERKMQGYFSELEEGNILIIVDDSEQ
ncbi:heat induced stress protein YflT [Trichococcus patagoniensis]|uniref:Heat induced stress protein YflT n=1 Tax=Trichococcus patagoniensis TaxID=382641 RepID=A0A2T5IC89_9LACT|nr:general stress protein [Trichococcus patagoniensis]PTQ81442.1 heat induced stress protein YflT [Trichococcus patagoniensis]